MISTEPEGVKTMLDSENKESFDEAEIERDVVEDEKLFPEPEFEKVV